MNTELFGKLYRLEKPFYVKEVRFDKSLKRLDVDIDFIRGSEFLYNEGSYDESCKVSSFTTLFTKLV